MWKRNSDPSAETLCLVVVTTVDRRGKQKEKVASLVDGPPLYAPLTVSSATDVEIKKQ